MMSQRIILILSFLSLTVILPEASARVVFSTESNGTHEQTFYIDSADTADDFIDLEFGSGIDARLRYDVTEDEFKLNRDVEVSGYEIQNVHLEELASAPTCDAASESRVYYNTTLNKSFVCDGTTWITSSGSLSDDDNDTQIKFDLSSDDDTLRFDTAGTERAAINENGDFILRGASGTGSTITLNEGKGNVGTGPDIAMSAQGLISAESNLIFNIDSDNDTTTSYVDFLTDANTTSGTNLMRLTEDGDLDISDQLAVGASASITSSQVFQLEENFAVDDNTYQLYSATTSSSPTLTGDRTSYGGYFQLVNNKTEDVAAGFDSNATAVHGYTRTNGTNTFGTNRGGYFEARNESTATSDLGNLYGMVGAARQQTQENDADITTIIGVQGQAYGSTSGGGGTTAGDVTNSYAVYGTTNAYNSDINSAMGTYGYVSTADSYAGNINVGYGARGRVRSGSDDGADITTAYAGYFSTDKLATANNIVTATGVYANVDGATTAYGGRFVTNDTTGTTNYGVHIDSQGASGNNYAIYATEGDFVLDADGDGISGGTGAGGDLVLGESQDLKIYHDGTTSESNIINSTGDLNIQTEATSDIVLADNGGKVGVGTSAPNTELEVDGIIRSGSATSTSGSTIIEGRYAGSDVVNVLGSHHSDGGTVLGYGARPKEGATGYVSSADNVAFRRGVVKLTDSLTFSNTPSVLIPEGDDVTFTEQFQVNSAGNVSQSGTTLTLDANNAGAGTNVSIIAEQGTDLNGQIRYNATTNHWEASDNGGDFQQLLGSDICGTHGAFTGERGTVASNQFMAYGNGRQTHGTPMGCDGEVLRIGGMCSGAIGTSLDIVLHKNNAPTSCTFNMSTTGGTATLEDCSETFVGTDVLNVKTGTEVGAWTECVATFWVKYD